MYVIDVDPLKRVVDRLDHLLEMTNPSVKIRAEHVEDVVRELAETVMALAESNNSQIRRNSTSDGT